MNELKVCPFCGKEPALCIYTRVTDEDLSAPYIITKQHEHSLKCDCGAKMVGKSFEDAIEKWNRRVNNV